MKALLSVVLLTFTGAVAASTLETPNYLIKIEENCEEGVVSCGDILYVGTHKKSGKTTKLKGRSWHLNDKNGDPGRYIGYKFKKDNLEYQVFGNGTFIVIKGKDEVLVEEKGSWTY